MSSARHGYEDARKLTLKLYEKAVKNGNEIARAEASFRLALSYYKPGKKISLSDLKTAMGYLENAADLNHIQAQYYLSMAYSGEYGGEIDSEKSFYWMNRSAESGFILAQKTMGFMYQNGNSRFGIVRDSLKAEEWLLKAHKASNDLYASLGALYTIQMDGYGERPEVYNPEKGLKYLEEGVTAGDQFSYLQLAIIYEYGAIVEKDVKRAIELYIEASQLPAVSADRAEGYIMKALGAAIKNDEFDKRLIHYALPILMDLAEKDNINAQLLLARLYDNEGLEDYDEEESLYWLRKNVNRSIEANEILFRKSILDVNASFTESLKYLENQIKLVEKEEYRVEYKRGADITLYHTAANYAISQHQPALAEQYLRRASMLHSDGKHEALEASRDVNVAAIYAIKGEYEKSEDLLYRLMAFFEESNNDELLYQTITTLFLVKIDQDNYRDAAEYLANVFNDVHFNSQRLEEYYKIIFNIKIAYAYILDNNYELAEEYLLAYEKEMGKLNSVALHNLTPIYNIISSSFLVRKGKYKEANKLIDEGKENVIKRKSGVDDIDITFIAKLARVVASEGHYEYAIKWLDAILSISKGHSRKYAEGLVNAISDYIAYSKNVDAKYVSYTSFDLMQMVSSLSASESIETSLSRNRKTKDEREIQKKIDDLRIDKRTLIKEKYHIAYDDRKNLNIINKKLDDVDRKIGANNILLSNKGEEIISAVKIGDVKKHLHENDALISILVSDRRTHVWVITKTGIKDIFQPFGRDEMALHVHELRKALNPTKLNVIDFPYKSSAILYDNIIRPILTELSGVDRLIIIPHGPVTNIPFSVFLSSTEDFKIEELERKPDDNEYYFRGIEKTHSLNVIEENVVVNANWLIEDFALASVPSISSYIQLTKVNSGNNERPNNFLGVGNPVLSGNVINAGDKILAANTDLRGNYSDASLSMLAPLPETEDELNQQSKVFRSSRFLLGSDATEASLKNMNLREFDVISFATHALVAGELPSVLEPSIVLTPVNRILPGNDGLLTATEISYLDMDADMVILSACNTAASDGKSSTYGLSGLASAFFYAGAESLFVSYWSVVSSSAVDITTGMFTHWSKRSYAHRHQASIIDMLSTSNDKRLLHPAYWAPFSVIGIN